MAAAIPVIAGAAYIGGKVLSAKGKNKAEKDKYEQGRAEYERAAAARAARAQLAKAIMQGYGIEGTVDPKLLEQIGNPTAFPKFAGSSNWMTMLGGGLQDAAGMLASRGMGGMGGGQYGAMNSRADLSPFMNPRGSAGVQLPGGKPNWAPLSFLNQDDEIARWAE